jgi:preprotein translocase subunit SecE
MRIFGCVRSSVNWSAEVSFGGVIVAFLSKVKRGFGTTFAFIGDSWSELKKVKWPGRKEIISYTIVVMTTVAFVTIYFALLDLGISEVLRVIFK